MKTLQLSRNKWYTKVFFAGMEICAKFTRKTYLINWYNHRDNLCHFIRTIVVYIPLIILAHLATIGAMLGALVILPIRFWGVGNLAEFARFGLLGIGTVIGSFFLIAYVYENWHIIREWFGIKKKQIPKEPKIKEPSFLKIWGHYLKEKKDNNLCALIEFKD